MLGRLSRTAAAVMMVGLIAGAAVAFSLGVPIHSAATCNNEVTYGTTCPGNPLTPFTVTSPVLILITCASKGQAAKKNARAQVFIDPLAQARAR